MDDDRQRSANAYLDNIVAALRTGAHIRARDVLDPWFAFETGNDDATGAAFITRGGQPHTFNNPCPRQHWQTLRHPHFWVTPAAWDILKRAEEGDRSVRKDTRDPNDESLRLMVDHSVPLARIIAEMRRDEGLWSQPRLRDFLLHHFRRGVLTKIEDRALNATWVDGVCLKEDMPPKWSLWGDPFARYKAVSPALEQALPKSSP